MTLDFGVLLDPKPTKGKKKKKKKEKTGMLVTLYSLLRNKFKEDENSFHMKRRLHELIFNKTSATAS